MTQGSFGNAVAHIASQSVGLANSKKVTFDNFVLLLFVCSHLPLPQLLAGLALLPYSRRNA